MAVNPMQPFVWGRGGQALSYEELMRQRDYEAQQAAQGVDFSPVGHWTQGAARVANALAGSVNRGQINSQIADANAKGAAALNSWFGGGQAASPVSAAPEAGSGPAVALDPNNPVYSGFMGAVQEGGVTNPNALAAIASTGHAESRFNPGNANRTWSDPSVSGQPGTAGGIMSWRGDRLNNLYSFAAQRGEQPGNISPATQAAFFLAEDPQLIQSLQGAQSVQEAQTLMNNAWRFANYDKPGGEAARRIAVAMSLAPNFSGQNSGSPVQTMPYRPAPGAGGDVAQNMPYQPGGAPAQLQMMGGDAPMMPAAAQPAVQVASADNGDMNPILMALAKRGGAVQDQAAAPVQQIARALAPAQSAPQQVAQAGPNQQRLMAIMSDQRLPPQTRSLAASMLQNQMEAQQQASDPLRRLQLERAELENQRLRQQGVNGPDETFFGNPVAITNPDGSIGYGQIGNRGTFRPIQLQQGQSFAPPTRNIDAGNETIIVDQAGNVVSRVPKNSFQPAFDAASGSAQGTAAGGATAAAPQDYQAAQNALDLIDNIKNDPYRARGTGFSSYGNVIRGTGGYDFQNKVDQAKSGAFLTAIQQMRGLGALSNAEGDAATSAITRMDTATSEEGFLAALDDYKKIVEQGKARAEKRMGGAPAPPQAGTGTSDEGWTTLPNGVRIRQKAP